VLDDRRACKEKAVPVVGLVARYSLSHSVWDCPLVGNTHIHSDIRRADVGDNRPLLQLNDFGGGLNEGTKQNQERSDKSVRPTRAGALLSAGNIRERGFLPIF